MDRLSRCFNIADLRQLAQRRLPKGLFEFIDRGSESEVALKANRDAFDRLMLDTKFMVDLSKRDFGTELFGKRSELPLAIAPTGLAGVCWREGEVGLAKAAAKAGIPLRSRWARSPRWRRSRGRSTGGCGSRSICGRKPSTTST